ncbi:MAG: NAD-dependent malic enzyme, partial [Gammaproteobacteria bacterium]|nr:NAD-dependent malic enzyme [Gammaproteobacteria bacterium]
MPQNRNRPVYISQAGHHLLGTALLNKGSAFSVDERRAFNLEGLIPTAVETIEEQIARAYQQYRHIDNDLAKHIFLRHIQDTNETLFLRLVTDYIEEMLPLIYTPTVGMACQMFSQIYRNKRGVFLTYENRDHIEDVLRNATKPSVKVIVITDSQRILGLGDQGIGGMGIPIGKLSIYSACGGISPAYTLPI